MTRLDQGLDVAPGDVLALMRDAEAHALDRQLGGLRCGDVMSRDVVTVGRSDSLYRVRILINQHRVKALPVVAADGRVDGIVSIVDLFNRDAGDVASVESVMTTDVAVVHEDTPVAALVELMAERGLSPRAGPRRRRTPRRPGVPGRADQRPAPPPGRAG